MPKLGLIGRHISYSFSKAYFTQKFENENLPFTYENYDIETITQFPSILKNNPDLVGLNVTIPYKEQIVPFLDDLSQKARAIGAVNTITISTNGKLTGHNTDAYGFRKSIEAILKKHHKDALILGTGGASKAIAFTLKELGIKYEYVSRSPNNQVKYSYSDLTEDIIGTHQIIINCTPVGTHPNVNDHPDIPYNGITKHHLIYDLIYNPLQTKFLFLAQQKGAVTSNGLKMLELQAEKAWEIWNLQK